MTFGYVGSAHTVDRPALRQKLDGALFRPLTLIVAQAGSGKSVLLAQWRASHPELDYVWIDLEAADDDPVRFGQRLLGGLAAVRPQLGELATLLAMHGGGLGVPLVEALSSELSELPPVVIVLDDLHHLSNASLLGDLGRLVELLPPNVHVVLSSRVDPPFAWSRHRVDRNLIEIRQSDLALDEIDSTQLLQRLAGKELGPDQVSALVNRTEGWAAGLQLAAMTLKVHHDSDDFIAQFSGSDRLIADYLGEEVLQAQPAHRRALLLRISPLDAMCAELVGFVTGEPNPQALLEELERDSMFLVPLDTRREWFRFHHLFRDLLRYRARAEEAIVEAQVLGQAASWHLDRGEVSQAVEYFVQAKQWGRLLELIMSRGSDVFEQGQMVTVIRWIEAIPEAARGGRQDVALLLGILKGVEGQAASAEDVLHRVATRSGSSPGERACAQALIASLAQWRPRPETSVTVAVRALKELDELGDHPLPNLLNLTDLRSLETIVTISLGRAHFLAGDMEEARAWLKRGLASEGAAYSIWRISGLGSLGLLEAWCGCTERARTYADEALAVASEVGMLAHPAAADAFLALTLTNLERGEPQHAALSLHEGALRAAANKRAHLSWVAHLELALLQTADGQPESAASSLLTDGSRPGTPPPPIVADRLLALRSQRLRLAGSADRARRTIGDSPVGSSALVFEKVATLLTLGEVGKAEKILEASPDPEPAEPLVDVERQILRAWLSKAQSGHAVAKAHLAEALQVAEPHSLVEVFVRAGPPILSLLAEEWGPDQSFCNRVIERARALSSPHPETALADPLTDRELEILSYLPSRFTNTELADRCYVSLNTMKTHMAHIYRKLDVANRNGAIVRARQLGLL